MIDQIARETPGEIEPLEGVVGEAIDLADESFYAVYSRSALHELDACGVPASSHGAAAEWRPSRLPPTRR